MDNQIFDKLIHDLEEIKSSSDVKTSKKLDIELLQRIIKRLNSFSPECEECKGKMNELESHINEIKAKSGQLSNEDFKKHNLIINSIKAHMQKAHNIVSEGYYMSFYMSLGVCFSFIFGMLVFDNIAMGVPMGMLFGLAIGNGMDADAKKKGKTL